MGYHSADYDHDWQIGATELSRVATLKNTTDANGIITGCYKVDLNSIDGFAPDTNRSIDEPVTLTQYHSADYNQDGRIDDNEYARVAELYNYRYQDITLGGYVRTGQYHDNNPQSIDGFGLGPVSLSDYSFASDHKPTINTKITPSGTYVLRAKFIDRSSTGFQAATSLNNNGFVLDSLPPPGVYNVELYWVKYSVNGNPPTYTIWQIGEVCKVVVVVNSPEEKCKLAQASCICGDQIEEAKNADNPDKGQCFPYRTKLSCNTPDIPIPECKDILAYPVFTPGATPPFYVVSRLFDSLCNPITDQSNKDILTIIK